MKSTTEPNDKGLTPVRWFQLALVIPSKSDFCFFVEPFLGGISPKKRRVSSLVATLHEEETALYLDARQPLFVVKYTK